MKQRPTVRRNVLTVAVGLMLVAAVSLSAQPGGHTRLDPSQAFEVQGVVLELAAGYGAGMPYLAVEDVLLGRVDVALGPYWYLRDSGFSALAGDSVSLLAYPCQGCALPTVAAWVENSSRGVTIELRDEGGYPLWMGVGSGHGWHPLCDSASLGNQHGGGGGNGHGGGNPGGGGGGGGNPGGGGPGGGGGGGGNPGGGGPGGGGGGGGNPGGGGPGPYGGQCNWVGPDMGAVQTLSGTVVSIDTSPGGRGPHMLFAAEEQQLDLLLSPFHPIVAAGLLIEEGMHLSVTVAPIDTVEPSLWVVISLTDPATGLTIQLRDPETGFPIHGGPWHG